MKDEIMDVCAVARYLQLHVMTVYKLVREGKIPMKKVGGQWRVQKTAIERWMSAR